MVATGMRLHLWAKADKPTREFEYCSLIVPIDNEGTKPMQVRFRLLSPLPPEMWARFDQGAAGLGGNAKPG